MMAEGAPAIGKNGPELLPVGGFTTSAANYHQLEQSRAERLTRAELAAPPTPRAALLTRHEIATESGNRRPIACTCVRAEITRSGCTCAAAHDEDDEDTEDSTTTRTA